MTCFFLRWCSFLVLSVCLCCLSVSPYCIHRSWLSGGLCFWVGNCYSFFLMFFTFWVKPFFLHSFFYFFYFLGGRFGFWRGKFACWATRCALWLCVLLLYCWDVNGGMHKFKCSLISWLLIASWYSGILLCAHLYWVVMLYKWLELGHGWLEWSLFRYILIWLWSEKGVCCLPVTALREKGSKYVIA